jgi:hypothetical protein
VQRAAGLLGRGRALEPGVRQRPAAEQLYGQDGRAAAGSATAGSPKDRLSLCKAFIAKAAWDFPTTRDLIDAAYDAKEIRQMSERLGHVAIIDHNPRRDRSSSG